MGAEQMLAKFRFGCFHLVGEFFKFGEFADEVEDGGDIRFDSGNDGDHTGILMKMTRNGKADAGDSNDGIPFFGGEDFYR